MRSLRTVAFYSFQPSLPLAVCILLAACEPSSEKAAPEDSPANTVMVPQPEPPLERAELMFAVARAASAAAAGVDDSVDQRALDGRRFELRIRFGCRGSSPDLQEAMFGWALDRESGTFRIKATPTISFDQEVVQQIAGEEFEAAEGFWIPRPWLLDPACPAATDLQPPSVESAEESEPPPSGEGLNGDPLVPDEDAQETRSPQPASPMVGIAEFFRETDSRTRRRGMQPYETVKTLEAGQSIGSQGFNLVLSGRLRALPTQQVIACASRGPDSRPACIVSARVDRVRLERPDTRELLAEWGAG